MDKKEVYIGKANIKYLNKDNNKLGAFIEMDYDELVDLLFKAAIVAKVPLRSVKLKVLPNKANDGYTCKIKIE